MGKTEVPLLSCLCVTDNRVHFLERSVNCFLSQSYPNTEMIIVCKDNDVKTLNFIDGLQDKRFVTVQVPHNQKFTLGELRNISLEKSHGEYFCQWDDDDWYHRDRLLIQFNNVTQNNHPATMLTNILMFDVAHPQAYFSGFRLWEPTVFGKSTLFNRIKYMPLQKSEDHVFMNHLLLESKIYPTIACNLYIYVYHGNNTCDKEHFNFIFKNAQKLPVTVSILIRDILIGKYSNHEASDLLGTDVLLNEINYFYYRGKLLEKEREEAVQTEQSVFSG